MSDPFVEKLNEKHLCSWYILPLLGLNVYAFGENNFIDAYQVRNRPMIAVHVQWPSLCPNVLQVDSFVEVKHIDGQCYLLYEVPEIWMDDYETFLEGKYSHMSEDAKQQIRELSGLKYEVEDYVGNKLTDAILMALENHHVLREKWKEIIGTTEFWMPPESLSKLSESSFITIESL